MTKREIILVAAIVVVLIGFGALWFWQSAPVPAPVEPKPVAQKPVPPPSVPPSWPVVTTMAEYPQLSLKNMSREEATKISVARLMKDHDADWKVALNFYGKVVDENNQPVAGANVHFDWNTIGVIGGTAYAQTLSDGNGLFSLTGQHGKILGVLVQKNGYYSVDRGGSSVPFEYANPSSPYWYEPDSNSPVIFHLRKKGEGAKLFSKSLTILLNPHHPQDRVNLIQGSVKPDGILTITLDASNYGITSVPFPWTAALDMAEGGLIETTDQFPFMAPETGYTSTATMAMSNLDRSVWRGQMTKTYYFYLPSTNTYGRMTVNASASLPLELSYVYNLTPGSRVLEPASK